MRMRYRKGTGSLYFAWLTRESISIVEKKPNLTPESYRFTQRQVTYLLNPGLVLRLLLQKNAVIRFLHSPKNWFIKLSNFEMI